MDVFRAPMGSKETPIGSPASTAIGLGRLVTERGITDQIRYPGDQGICVIGQNGKGKGTRILIPNLLQNEGNSIVVVDPKGELSAVTAKHRMTLGRVVILNPFNVLADRPGYEYLETARFNPLAHLDPESDDFNSDAAELADAMITINGNETQKHFPQSARALLAALIMYATIEAKKKNEAPTMARVRELLCQASEGPHEGNKHKGSGLPLLALEMIESDIAGLRNKASQFTDWNREIQSIASTAKIETECFDDTAIANNMSGNDIDFRDLKREPMTVYLVLPPKKIKRHSKWLRLVLTCALQPNMEACQPGERTIWFMLDEFFALGYLEIIETVWALVRGYGIQMMPILQSIEQLQKLYPDLWQTFLGTAGAVVSFAANDMPTAKWLSERGGETTRQVHTNSVNGSSFGASSSPTGSPLITPHRMFGLKPGFMLGAFDGLDHLVPIYAPAYYEMERTKLKAQPNPYRRR